MDDFGAPMVEVVEVLSPLESNGDPPIPGSVKVSLSGGGGGARESPSYTKRRVLGRCSQRNFPNIISLHMKLL